MNIDELPVGSHPKALDFPHFPAKHQAVIFRNWELLPVAALARVLGATEWEILAAAGELGLAVPPAVEPAWLSRGYVTIVRANWQLLNYGQLLNLLGWTADRLALHLKEDDFLWTKLGELKPDCAPVAYRPLTPKEAEATRAIRGLMQSHFGALRRTEAPFGFLETYAAPEPMAAAAKPPRSDFDPQFLYSYSAVYGDPLLLPENDPFPEGLLSRYARMGITGVWLQVVLYLLDPIPGMEHLSTGWEKRLANLEAMAARAKKYGIGIYLYLNEPRGMEEAFFKQFPAWKGNTKAYAGNFALCTSEPAVLERLKASCTRVFRAAPGLAGAFTISMSENVTHCHSKRSGAECPRCRERPVAEVVAEVNRSIEEGIHAASPGAEVIVWTWAWDPAWAPDAIARLPAGVSLMSVSEWGKDIQVGGVENKIVDYSISQPGPSGESEAVWGLAAKRGLKTLAKVQLNNSWECSAIPYLPVPYLVREHLDNLMKAGVGGLMASWTLGGFPGGNLALLRATPEELAREQFGEGAPEILRAWKTFSEAFREFPFHVGVLYRGPHNMGPANLLHRTPTGFQSTMVGFPYDDLTGWRANYPPEIFEAQFQKLSEGWKAGLDGLLAAEGKIPAPCLASYRSLCGVSTGVYCHFRSAFLQVRFHRLRAEGFRNAAAVRALLAEEIELAKRLAAVLAADSTIGFEASNHYAYTLGDLQEKVISTAALMETF